jgi:hypothetical protein
VHTQQALEQRRGTYFEGGHAHIEQRLASLDEFFCVLADGLSRRTLDECPRTLRHHVVAASA